MNKLLIVIWSMCSIYSQEYNKHITPIDYEVPHKVIFRDGPCWSSEKEGDVAVSSNCTSKYCSRCFYNKDISDYRSHYLSYNDNRLIVAGLDVLLSFDVTDNLFSKLEQVDVSPGSIDIDARTSCQNKSNPKNKALCRNFNRVLLPLPDQGKILTCGTTAFSVQKACQIRTVKDLSDFTALKGEGFVPTNPGALNTALVSDSRVFAGTMIADQFHDNSFTICSAKIGTNENGEKAFVSIVSTLANAAWLNKAKFVGSFSSGDYAYFLFQEIQYEELSSGDQVVSRIARVCKEDAGNENVDMVVKDARLWQTFVKARIYCENTVIDQTFGEQIYLYNRIGHGILDDDRILYATFSEGDTSASGSVVCRFNLDEIDENFDTGLYYSFTGDDQKGWVAESRKSPTTCATKAESEIDYYDKTLSRKDMKSTGPPLFLQSGPQFTKLLLDTNVQNTTNPVLFIGTNKGKVLKVTWTTNEDSSLQPILIEALQVSVGDIDSDLTVNFLAFEKPTDPNYLLVGTGTSVSKVVISRCLRLPNLNQNCCYASRDPYCGWCAALSKCTSKQDCSSDWTQSLTADADDVCKGDYPRTIPSPVVPHTPGPEPIPTTKTDPPIELATDPPTDPPKTQLPEPQTNPPKNNTQTPDPNEPDSISNTTAESPGAGNTTSGVFKIIVESAPYIKQPIEGSLCSGEQNTTTEVKEDPTGGSEAAIKEDEASWKTVAIVMAILCGIFVLISLLLALNLARRWCSADKGAPQKQGHNNLQHSYNPLSTTGPKSEDVSDRIPVYNTRTNIV